MTRYLRNCLPLLAVILLTIPSAHAATITIINGDDPGEGFNDPTPVAPVPGNPGTTLGEQRLNTFLAAADRWGDLLVSDVEIRVLAFFDPLPCGTLGSSVRLPPRRDFPGAPLPGVWYQRPLADALAGTDTTPTQNDLELYYNSSYDNGVCAGGPWYYWISENPPQDPVVLVLLPVVLHEMSHGFGFATYVDFASGALFGGFPDIYTTFIYDATAGLYWDEMTNGQRAASAINNQQVVFDGPETKIIADAFLTGNNVDLIVNTGPAAGTYPGQGALFGASWANTDGLTLDMEIVDDGVGTATDACEPLVGFTPGRIAFVDRGTCQFGLKSLHAEQAGAGGVIIADNQVSTPFQMAPGDVGRQVTITVNYIIQADGDVIRPTLPASGTFDVIDVNGMHPNGLPALYAGDNPATGGSSISHFDVFAGPNALMEPSINPDLFTDLDMTPGVFRDEGWTVESRVLFEDGFESGDTTMWSMTFP